MTALASVQLHKWVRSSPSKQPCCSNPPRFGVVIKTFSFSAATGSPRNHVRFIMQNPSPKTYWIVNIHEYWTDCRSFIFVLTFLCVSLNTAELISMKACRWFGACKLSLTLFRAFKFFSNFNLLRQVFANGSYLFWSG